MTCPTHRAGRGRLCEVLAMRAGRAEREALFAIEHREGLIHMLCQTAELEHGIVRQHLFAAYSLTQPAVEELGTNQPDAVTRWRRTIAQGFAHEESARFRVRPDAVVSAEVYKTISRDDRQQLPTGRWTSQPLRVRPG